MNQVFEGLKMEIMELIWVLITVWKLKDFSVIQILREINFGQSRSSKTAIFAILGALKMLIWAISAS